MAVCTEATAGVKPQLTCGCGSQLELPGNTAVKCRTISVISSWSDFVGVASPILATVQSLALERAWLWRRLRHQ